MKDVKAYLSVGNCFTGVWQDEKTIAYINTDPNGRSIVTKDINSGEEKILYSTEERIMDLYVHQSTGHVFFTSDIGGTENAQVFIIKKGTKEAVNLTNDSATMFQIGGLLPDGKTLIVSCNKRVKSTFDITKINIDTKEMGMVKQNDDNYNMPASLSPNGKYLLYNKLMGTSNNPLWMLDINTGEAVKTPGNPNPASYTKPAWKSDSSGFYLITDEGSDFEYAAYYSITEKTLSKIYECNWDVMNISLSSCDRYLTICINEGGYSIIRIFDTLSKSFCNPPSPPKGVSAMYWKMPWSPGGLKLLFTMASGKRPMNFWVLDMEEDSVRKITSCYTAGLTGEDFVEPVLKEFSSFDGLKVPYWLYVPPGKDAKNLPVMVHIHGGPEGQSMPTGIPFYHFMVQQGIAVVEPNVRGSTGYGKNYTRMDDVEKRLDSVKDIEYLVKDLLDKGIADKHKLSVSGGSYGGFMTLNCAARYPELWCCAVDIVGMFNLVTFLENTSDYRRPHREAEYGTLAQHRDILLEVSPIAKVDGIKGPLMIIHGKNDPRVPVSEAHQATEYLTKRGVDVELLIYDDEGHGIVKMKNLLDCFPKVIDFVKKHMKIS
ncbi:MAG: S9 family peptidase [Treponema sp.]|nr:S9 family peptidase [Treponema sp.]